MDRNLKNDICMALFIGMSIFSVMAFVLGDTAVATVFGIWATLAKVVKDWD